VKVEWLRRRSFPSKKVVGALLALLIVGIFVWQSPALIQLFTPLPSPVTPPQPSPVLSTCFEGFSLTQNGTHLIIEDFTSRWAPQYSISLKNGTRLFNLAPYMVEDGVVAEYAYVNRSYTKQVYNLDDIFERLPQGSSTYVFEIYTHDRRYDFTVDFDAKKILFGGYTSVKYLPSITIGNTVYEVVFMSFNEYAFQRIRESVFEGLQRDDMLSKIWHLVEWAESNIKYEHSKTSPYIYDPLTFMEKKRGVCIDYAMFYALALLAIGFDEAYVLTLYVGGEGHAAAGVEYGGTMLVLEQHLPVMELQDYIQYSEMIFNASISPPIYAYKISRKNNGSAIEFFKISRVDYEDSTPIDGITEEFARDVAQMLSQKLGARVIDAVLPYSYTWSWGTLRFYTSIFHDQWVEYVSDIIAKGFAKSSISPRVLTVEKIDLTALRIRFERR